jgi:hypothetical protein
METLTRGPKRKTDLFDRLERVKVGHEIVLAGENERNRALKFARKRKLFFVTRTTPEGKAETMENAVNA